MCVFFFNDSCVVLPDGWKNDGRSYFSFSVGVGISFQIYNSIKNDVDEVVCLP